MSNDLDRMKNSANKAIDKLSEYPVSRKDRQEQLQSAETPAIGNALFNFRYAYMEISSHGSKTYLKSRETRFENGKLVAEECEGSLDHDAAQRMLTHAQHQFFGQAVSLMKSCLAFWPIRPFDR